MRWRRKEPNVGDVRERKYFAWLPININGDVRWLETVHVMEERMTLADLGEFPAQPYDAWVAIRFAR